MKWAVPLYKGLIKARLGDGTFQTCIVVGLDDATLIGGPPVMVAGRLADLRQSDAVIVDLVGASDKLARPAAVPGKPIPLQIGGFPRAQRSSSDCGRLGAGDAHVSIAARDLYDVLPRHAVRAARAQAPVVRASEGEGGGEHPAVVAERIRRATGLAAYTREAFTRLTVDYFMANTGIPVNLGSPSPWGSSWALRSQDKPSTTSRWIISGTWGAEGNGDLQRHAAGHDPAAGAGGRQHRLRARRRGRRRCLAPCWEHGVGVPAAVAATVAGAAAIISICLASAVISIRR